MSYTKQKIIIRKAIVQYKRALHNASDQDRLNIIESIVYNQRLLKAISELDVTQTYEVSRENLPTLGKLRMIIEKDLKDEYNRFKNDADQSDVDLKRLTLKEAFLEYYNNLNYDYDTIIVDFESDMTLRRDDQDVDKSDFDLAPNKNEIYQRWMEKLNRYVREKRLSEHEYDEAYERGIPQGGAFEKQLDRYRKDIMQKLWQDYYQQRKDQWKIQ